MAVEVEYRCEDGTPFPVAFETEDDAAASWVRDGEHSPHRVPPMAEALPRMGEPGSRRAYEELGMARPSFFRPGPKANGFAYFFNGEPPSEEVESLMNGCAAVLAQHGSALGAWRERCLPTVQQDCEAIATAGLDVPLRELSELASHALQMTMVPAFICGNDLDLLGAAIKGRVEGDPVVAAAELVQGLPNPTVDAGRRLWELGRAIAASPVLREAIDADDPRTALDAARSEGAEAEFFAALDAFLAEFGGRAEGWDIAFPTWRELGPGFLGLLRVMARPDAPDPGAVAAAGAARRAALVADVESALADDPDGLARFRRRLERCEPYVVVREERAHWQLVSVGELRHAVLRHGRAMVEAGVVEREDDVLFLEPEEVEGFDPGVDLRDLVAARRAEHDHWLSVTAPPKVGTGAAAAGPGSRGELPPAEPSPDGSLKGIAASRGTATGPVRVVLRLDDADGFEPGEILVCRMTSPPWTPLFAIASAVVTDSGDTGSHSAIAAREYGIPCVVSVPGATSLLSDGDIITVDGATGVVRRAS